MTTELGSGLSEAGGVSLDMSLESESKPVYGPRVMTPVLLAYVSWGHHACFCPRFSLLGPLLPAGPNLELPKCENLPHDLELASEDVVS